jgi:uncharacterized protein (TIRG00374 family)
MDDVRSFIDAFHAFANHLAAVGWGALALACLLHFVRLTARSRAWQNILIASTPKARIPFWSVFGGYWAGVAVNAISPARGGDVVKAYIVKHRVKDLSYPTIGSTLVVETLFDFVVAIVLIVVAIAMGLLPGIPDLPNLPAFDWSFGVRHPRLTLTLFSLFLAVVFIGITWAARHVEEFKEKVRAGFSILGDFNRYLREVVSWQALSWGLRIAAVYFFLRAFHIPATFDTVVAVLVVQGLSTALPFTPGGAGTQQAVLVFALSGWASKSAVLSFSVGMQLATVIVNVAIGFTVILLIFGSLRWRDHVKRDRSGPAPPSDAPATVRSRSAPPS